MKVLQRTFSHSYNLWNRISNRSITKETVSIDSFEETKAYLKNLKTHGDILPSNISENQLEKIGKEDSFGKKRYLNFLYSKEINSKASKWMRISHKYNVRKRRNTRSRDGHIQYTLWKNSAWICFYPPAVRDFRAMRTLTGLQWAPSIIFDCSFMDHMSEEEQHVCSQEVLSAMAHNSRAEFPLKIHLCQVDYDSHFYQRFSKRFNEQWHLPIMYDITEEKATDIFPKQKLVQLSPDAEEVLEKFDPECTYIISGLVDFENKSCLSLQSAEAMGIKSLRLPLERVKSHVERPELDIECVFKILLELQSSGDLSDALNKNYKRTKQRLLQKTNKSHSMDSS